MLNKGLDSCLKSFLKFSCIFMCIGLSACSTVDGVGSLNPFANDDDTEGQGEVAGEEERVSIIALDETLVASGAITPDDVVLPPAYINSDWPQTGGNPAHVLQHTSASGQLKPVWSKNVGKGSSRTGRVLAQPVVGGGRIFVMDGQNQVAAYDAQNGSKQWDYKLKAEKRERTRRGRTSVIERISDPLSVFDRGGSDSESVGGGIALADGRIYVTSGLGIIEALDAVNGDMVWRKSIRTPLHSAPTVYNGRLFATSDDNELFALDADTGEVLWTYQAIVENARMLTAPSPAVIDDVVISPFASGELVALRVQNGGVLWQDALSGGGLLTPLSSLNDIAAGPVIVDGYVIASAQSGITSAFDLRTGQRVWSQPAGSIGFPWVAGDFVYTVTTEGKLVCMSKIDGQVVWIQNLPAFKDPKKRKKRIAWSGPILAGERLFLVSSRGNAVEINPYNGAINREFSIDGKVFISPVIANETVYLLTDKAKLIALR